MFNELYLYSYPKVLKDTPSIFKIWHIFYLLLPAFALAVVSIIYSIVVMSISSVLYLLCFVQKNAIIRHMKILVVFAFMFASVSAIVISAIYPELKVGLYSIIGCIILSIIYEIVILVKIKKRLYSKSININQKVYIGGASLIGLFVYFINKFLLKIQTVHEIVMLTISSLAMLCVVISVQKLIIYLFTRNKIQTNCEDVKETDEIDKKG